MQRGVNYTFTQKAMSYSFIAVIQENPVLSILLPVLTEEIG